jgi:hypothetical protein
MPLEGWFLGSGRPVLHSIAVHSGIEIHRSLNSIH